MSTVYILWETENFCPTILGMLELTLTHCETTELESDDLCKVIRNCPQSW